MKIVLAAVMLVPLVGCNHAQKKPQTSPKVAESKLDPKDWQTPGYHGARWWAESARLTHEQREELADITPSLSCGNCTGTWNDKTLRWEEDFEYEPDRKGRVGPHAILPLSEARAEEKRQQEDAEWCDPKTELGMSNGYQQFACYPNAKSPHPDRMGRWAENKEAEADMAKEESHKDDLAAAMTTRVLTKAEYKEVLAEGSNLLTHPMQPYFQKDVDERFEHMLRIQDELRRAAK